MNICTSHSIFFLFHAFVFSSDLAAAVDAAIMTADKEKILVILQTQSPVAIVQLIERSHVGYSFLHDICKLGYTDVAQILITYGADINKTSPEVR